VTDDRGAAESVRNRLRNVLRARGEDAQTGLQRYAVEGFLRRLGRSEHRDKLVLKGGTLLSMLGTTYRPTRDIDFTGYFDDSDSAIRAMISGICTVANAGDPLRFDPGSITVEPIRDESEYHGKRVALTAHLGDSIIPVRIDIGFGNAIVPGPVDRSYRTLLGDPEPNVRTYPTEAVIAEKMHAMVILGERNSRYKDFYDVHVMASAFPFDRETIVLAVRATFERRRTALESAIPAALTAAFYADGNRATQWRAYVTRNGLIGVPADFQECGGILVRFLGPVWQRLTADSDGRQSWSPGGPWR
jgi:predicted nucleotidyltransferase component of viral defense system